MRIADYTRVWTTHGLGGMQVRAAAAAQGLARLGHEVHVFTTSLTDSDVSEAIDGGVTVHYLPGATPRRYSTEYFDSGQKLCRELGPFDVVHSNSTAGRRHLGGATPVVATWHGVGSPQDDANLLRIGGTPHGSRFDPSVLRYDWSIVVGPHEEQLLISHGVPRERVQVVLHGLDQKQFAPDPAARTRVRRSLGFAQNDFVLGVAGRMVFDKGVHQVLAAIPHLDPGIRLLAIGEGNAIEAKAAKHSLKSLHCTHDQMADYYNAMDLLVNASARNQGFDMTIVEAMLCGTPILMADSNPAREVMVCGVEVFPLGDALQLAAKANAIARSGIAGELGKGARAFAELFFTEERMIRQVEAVLCSAAAR